MVEELRTTILGIIYHETYEACLFIMFCNFRSSWKEGLVPIGWGMSNMGAPK
jgi:hypothetical protein